MPDTIEATAADPYGGSGRPALRWDVKPALIEGMGAETAETAESPLAVHPLGETVKIRTGSLSILCWHCLQDSNFFQYGAQKFAGACSRCHRPRSAIAKANAEMSEIPDCGAPPGRDSKNPDRVAVIMTVPVELMGQAGPVAGGGEGGRGRRRASDGVA